MPAPQPESLVFPAAVFFDMDGTLVDTENYWIAAEEDLVREHGGEWTAEDGKEVVGTGLWESAEIFRSHGVDMSVEEIVAELSERVRQRLARDGYPWRPGAIELLRELRAAGVATALVTMSLSETAANVVAAIGFHAFDLQVCGDMVAESKPHPEPYLRAAAGLGVDPAHGVAIEDSPPGVSSAVAAGLLTIGVPNLVPLDDTPAHAIWPTLAGRGVSDLRDLVAARSA